MGDSLDLSPMDTPDSPESLYTTSPSVSPKRDVLMYESSENGNKATSCIRFLVSNAAAGSVIGKGGATVNDFQMQSGAKIRLSRNREYFPGTFDRIISLSGTVNEILTAFNLISSKLLNESEENPDVEHKPNQVRLIVPNFACGAIIGKGGATIKSFVEDSQATIKLSSQEQTLSGMSDRLVTITGTQEQQTRAIFLIVSKLSEDPNYAQYASTPLSYTGVSLPGLQGIPVGYGPIAYGLPNYASSGAGSNLRNTKGLIAPLVAVRSPMPLGVSVVHTGSSTTSVTMAVPDEHVGAIVGRGGRTIFEIQQVTGARIKISDRGDFISGTKDRQVTISGASESVQLAQLMVEQKISSDLDR